MLKHKNVLVFLGQTLLYFAIFMALIYLYNYLDKVKVILSITNLGRIIDEYKN